MQNKATNEALLLKNVPDIPNFHKNIVSIGTFVRNGKCKLGMKKSKMTSRKQDKLQR
jgi:hypothetical protein